MERNGVCLTKSNIKFCTGLEKIVTETYKMLKHVQGSNTISRTQYLEWHRRFKESVKDDKLSGRPQSSYISENIEKSTAEVHDWKYTRIYNPQRRLRVLVEKCRKDSSHNEYKKWVPSHVNVCENEIADGLTREGSHKNSMHGGCLVFSEIATRAKQDVSSSWKQAPVHEWYAETILVLLCLGQVVGEMKLLLLGFAVGIFELNDMWWKFTLVRIAV
ncbi:uncharacterized protein TNCV_3255291 [Trichonephila clavipes]|nr:uncharacterized protein TNCV_3255291 [Trichonephila clavipes]